jgi:tetratricopeptide (TPR) repeat protein
MKTLLQLFFLIALPFFSIAQKLSDASSFKKAIELSNANHKPLLLIISIKVRTNANTASMPNIALKAEDVVKKMKENFTVFETDRSDTTIATIISANKIRSFPTFLFTHANGDVFYSEFGNSSSKNKYLSMLDKAIFYSKEKSISTLESEYLANKKDNEVLKNLIETRRRNGLSDNAALIEQYVGNLKIGSFNDYETILFILQAGPYTDGNAYRYAYTNRKVVDSIYKKESIPVRTAINNGILSNTMTNAKKTKNLAQAQSAASFLKRTTSKNPIAANRNYAGQMLSYYIAVNDTTNYLKAAVLYYDSYFMNISADSIKSMEAKLRIATRERSIPLPMASLPTVSKKKIDSLRALPNSVIRRDTISAITTTPSMTNTYANALNGAAWKFYETGTKNISYLLKAVAWSTRSIELNQNANAYDTLARLFYRLGYFEQAIKTEQTAINQAKIDGRSYEKFQDNLKKMKSKTL